MCGIVSGMIQSHQMRRSAHVEHRRVPCFRVQPQQVSLLTKPPPASDREGRPVACLVPEECLGASDGLGDAARPVAPSVQWFGPGNGRDGWRGRILSFKPANEAPARQASSRSRLRPTSHPMAADATNGGSVVLGSIRQPGVIISSPGDPSRGRKGYRRSVCAAVLGGSNTQRRRGPTRPHVASSRNAPVNRETGGSSGVRSCRRATGEVVPTNRRWFGTGSPAPTPTGPRKCKHFCFPRCRRRTWSNQRRFAA